MIAAEAQNHSSTYNLFKFQMAITTAHEIVHFLTGFLTGNKLPLTTPRSFPGLIWELELWRVRSLLGVAAFGRRS
jgi:hypothetical protein